MTKITNIEILNLLHDLGILPSAVAEVSDDYYYTTDINTIKEFLAYDKTNYKAYQSEIFDCDDFSLVLDGRVDLWQPALPFGIAWSKTHAFNIFIDKDKNIWIIEPQTDAVMTLEQARQSRMDYIPIKFVMI